MVVLFRAWAGEGARGRSVHEVMLRQAAPDLRGRGARWLDLGSIDTEAAPGLAPFKLATGAALHRLGATGLGLTLCRRCRACLA